MTESNANKQIARATGTVMIALFLGQIAGLVRGIIVARTFGASPELDAFFAANRVSETLFLLVAGGALGSAFIPTFTGLLARDEKAPAWRLAAALANTVTLTLSLLALLVAIFAPLVVRYLLAPGLSTDPELYALTVSLLRIQLISTVFFGLGGLLVGILNAHQIFLIPALTPALYQSWDHLRRAGACAFFGNLRTRLGRGYRRGFISARANSFCFKTCQLVADH